MVKKNKNWLKSNQNVYKWLLNYMATKFDNIETGFIMKYQRSLQSIIENNDNWSDGSKSKLFFMMSKYLEINDPNKQSRYIKRFRELGFNYQLKVSNSEKDNEQDENEKKYYRSHQQLLKILDDINYDDIATINSHYQYLLLSLLVLQPPVRSNYYITATFIKNKKDNNLINNFLWFVNYKGIGTPKISYVINDDKVSNSLQYGKNKHSIINIDNEKLRRIIYDSYLKYPRSYLFENIKTNKPYTSQSLLNFLTSITGSAGININMMRSSYVNWFYNSNPTMNQKEELSKQMRHSVATSQTNYLKNIDDDNDEIKTNETKNELLEENIKLKNKVEICEPPEDSKLYKIRRRDLLYQNQKFHRVIRQSSIDKYKLKYDEVNKKYI
jgi:hypothetical protein